MLETPLPDRASWLRLDYGRALTVCENCLLSPFNLPTFTNLQTTQYVEEFQSFLTVFRSTIRTLPGWKRDNPVNLHLSLVVPQVVLALTPTLL